METNTLTDKVEDNNIPSELLQQHDYDLNIVPKQEYGVENATGLTTESYESSVFAGQFMEDPVFNGEDMPKYAPSATVCTWKGVPTIDDL